MGIDFRGMLRRLQQRLEQHALDKQEAQEDGRRMALFAAVGQALSSWGLTEESLVIITSMLLRTQTMKAGVVMYSISNFHIWLAIIDELFSMDQGCCALKPKWNKLNERLKQLNDTRVRLAHHYATDDDDFSLLKPGRLDARGKSQRYKHELDYDQISKFTSSVIAIWEDLTVLTNAVLEIVEHEESLQQKSSEQGSGQNPP